MLKINFIKTILLLTFAHLIVGESVFSQQAKFDSLKRLLPKTTNQEKKAILLIDIAKSICNSIPDSSIGYREQAESISKKII